MVFFLSEEVLLHSLSFCPVNLLFLPLLCRCDEVLQQQSCLIKIKYSYISSDINVEKFLYTYLQICSSIKNICFLYAIFYLYCCIVKHFVVLNPFLNKFIFNVLFLLLKLTSMFFLFHFSF